MEVSALACSTFAIGSFDCKDTLTKMIELIQLTRLILFSLVVFIVSHFDAPLDKCIIPRGVSVYINNNILLTPHQ